MNYSPFMSILQREFTQGDCFNSVTLYFIHFIWHFNEGFEKSSISNTNLKREFCDIRTDTFNMDEQLIEGLITPKTKAIYCVDYAGIPCEMDTINDIARRCGLFVIEDAAQAIGSTYKGRYAGTLCEFGCYSFHETKNYVMGEGLSAPMIK